MKYSTSFLDVRFFLFLSFILVLLTNNYFSLEESFYFGARDGEDYYIIADNFENLPYQKLDYHKAWRFILPSIIGITAKTFNFDVYLTFSFFTIIACISSIIFFYLILKKLKIDNFHIFYLTSFLIFNPYLIRYFLALPTMINDIVFINSGLIILLGLLNSKKSLFYFGFLLALFTRQNSIFFLLSIIISKFVFKNKSIIEIKDIIYLTILTFVLFLINNEFANDNTIYNGTYSLVNRFHLFTFDYTLLDFLKYNLFSLVIILPIFFYLIFEKKIFIFNNVKKEFFLITSLIVVFMISVAYVGGPLITGKNLIRLINLAYPLLLLSLIMLFDLRENKKFLIKSFFYFPLFFIWSLHPTYSIVNFFSFLKFNIF
ncbi:hypothetical protein ACIJYD_00845 [Candidatus Pelagibacter bacterium nBUS_33]|uniref:hypothetical protein n=1 Tax=Candidatus Pelagibacter bacterium nBUS_33 TaxID=3374193 RepID=UPI003EBB155F